MPHKLNKIFFRLALSLLAVVGFTFAVSAQVVDTTRQQPQLQTSPPAGPVTPPTRPTPRPAETVPAQTKTTTAPPVEDEEPAPERPTLLQKLFVGGSGDLGFRSDPYFGNYFNIGASPILGYRLTKNFAVGPGVVYQFYSMGGNRYQDYGVKAFTQLIIYKSFFAHAEHELLNTQSFRYDQQGRVIDQYRQHVQTTLIGGGYRQMASDRFGIDLYVLLPVATSATGGISNTQPVIRAGVIYNLK